MQEVQRFNKVLKSLVLFGDLILLNLLLWGFNLFLGTRFWCIHCGSIFQGMTLITLCYLLCNMHSGVILHRLLPRLISAVSVGSPISCPSVFVESLHRILNLKSSFSFSFFTFPIFRTVLCCFNNCYYQLSFNFPSLSGALSKKGRKCS